MVISVCCSNTDLVKTKKYHVISLSLSLSLSLLRSRENEHDTPEQTPIEMEDSFEQSVHLLSL
jgi:hypothetical protein